MFQVRCALVGLGLGCLVLGGCRSTSPAGVLLSLQAETPETRPAWAILRWAGPASEGTVERRLPVAGEFPAGGELPQVFVRLDERLPGSRRFLALGMRGQDQISLAAGRIDFVSGADQRLSLTFTRALSDADGDGWPDAVDDDCPGLGRCRAQDAGVQVPPDGAADPAPEDARPNAQEAGGPAPDVLAPMADALPVDTPVAVDGPAATADGPMVDLRPGLILHWKLDETTGTTVVDGSGLAHTGQLVGASGVPARSTDRPAALGAASIGSLEFRMADRHAVEISPLPTTLRPTTVTVAAWYKATALDTVAKPPGSDVVSGGDAYILRLRTNGVEVVKRDAAGWNECLAPASNQLDGNWHHLAGVVTEGSVSVYLDGKLLTTCAVTAAPIRYADQMVFAAARHGRGNTAFDFGGAIDDVRVWSRALTAAEIALVASGAP